MKTDNFVINKCTLRLDSDSVSVLKHTHMYNTYVLESADTYATKTNQLWKDIPRLIFELSHYTKGLFLPDS